MFAPTCENCHDQTITLPSVAAHLIFLRHRQKEKTIIMLNSSCRTALFSAIVLLAALAGCSTTSPKANRAQTDGAKADNKPAIARVVSRPTIRIKAGLEQSLTDSKGIVWAADSGFDGGETVDRPDLQVTGTDRPELYRAERYSMNSYSIKVPNGDYNLILHFSEDYDGLTAPTDRIFNYEVKDGDAASGKTVKEVKDFGPWKASGAQFKAYVDTVGITVTTGQITIRFTPQVENPQINAIEIVPR